MKIRTGLYNIQWFSSLPQDEKKEYVLPRGCIGPRFSWSLVLAVWGSFLSFPLQDDMYLQQASLIKSQEYELRPHSCPVSSLAPLASG